MPCSVLVGCNILNQLSDLILDPEHKDAEAWAMAIQWYRLTKNPLVGQDKTPQKVAGSHSVRTGKNPINLLPREVRPNTCQVRAPLDLYQGKLSL